MRDYIDLFDGAASNIWQNKKNGKNILLGEFMSQLVYLPFLLLVLHSSIGNDNIHLVVTITLFS